MNSVYNSSIVYNNKRTVEDINLKLADKEQVVKIRSIFFFALLCLVTGVMLSLPSLRLALRFELLGNVMGRNISMAFMGGTIAFGGLVGVGSIPVLLIANRRSVKYHRRQDAERILNHLANGNLDDVTRRYNISKLERYGYVDTQGAQALRDYVPGLSDSEEVQNQHFRDPIEAI